MTLDKDFGELAIVHGRPHGGILRLANFPARQQARACLRVLGLHGAELEAGAIVTAEPGVVRNPSRRPRSRSPNALKPKPWYQVSPPREDMSKPVSARLDPAEFAVHPTLEYESVGVKTQLIFKDVLKARLGCSPDLADDADPVVCVLRQLGVRSGEAGPPNSSKDEPTPLPPVVS